LEQIDINWGLAPAFYSVSELAGAIRGLLTEQFSDIWVAGEISGTRVPASGHYYFTLKDEGAQLKAVFYKMTARYLKFKPQDGIAVLARGRIDMYDARGEVQFVVEAIEPQGHGALQLAFEQLKKKLAAEGLFDNSRKRPMPALPVRIGIVTSPTGAVIRDILQILERRFPGRHIRIYPAQVQGEGAVEQVVAGLAYFSKTKWAEVVIVARGGGSLEDLWTFNEEAVARAIAACTIPVVSAVGHETDVTIADFVADLRAPTPSAAAELVVLTREDLFERIAAARAKSTQALRYRLAMLERRLRQQGIERALNVLHRRVGRGLQRIDEQEFRMRERIRKGADARDRARRMLETRLKRFDMRLRLATGRRRLDALTVTAGQCIGVSLTRRRGRLDRLDAKLSQLSPLRILERGYAIVSNQAGVVKDSAASPGGSQIHVRLAKGELDAVVE